MSGKIEGQFNKNRLREAAEYHGMYREKIESDILNFFKYNDLISRDVFLNSLPQHPLGSILACLEDLIKKQILVEVISSSRKKSVPQYRKND